MANQPHTKESKPVTKLWNKSFALLWQGTVVSSLGDLIYFVVLGFWILEKTGSTTYMGLLMGSGALTSLLMTPVAGVLADRMSRKRLIVGTDALRGAVVCLVGIAALLGHLSPWMLLVAGIVTKGADAFDTPAVNAALPDMVPPDKLTGGFSALNAGRAVVSAVGNPLAGVLLNLLGTPVMFLIDGIAYLVAAFTELFISIPPIKRRQTRPPDSSQPSDGSQPEGDSQAGDASAARVATPLKEMFLDIRQAARFIIHLRGLGTIMLCALVCTFFGNMAFTLMIPFFKNMKDGGPNAYGLAMAALSMGAGAAFLITMVWDIPFRIRGRLVIICGTVAAVLYALFPFVPFYAMLPMLFVGGFGFTLLSVFCNVALQQATPSELRGKISASINATTNGLSPLAMLLGGVLGDHVPIPFVFLVGMGMVAVIILSMSSNRNARRVLSFDPVRQKVDSLMDGGIYR